MKAPCLLFLSLVLCGAHPAAAQKRQPAALPAKKADDLALSPTEEIGGRPRVLLIGDSISMNYTAPTRRRLADTVNLYHIPVNGEATDAGLENLGRWLTTGGADRKWDVIHFNWGLHDLRQYAEGPLVPGAPRTVSLPDYEKNLRILVARLKKTGAKLIFATTTPVPRDNVGREPGIEIQYNAAARRVMQDEGVAIDDLYAAAAPHATEWQNSEDVHFNPAGNEALATLVAAAITTALQK